MKYIYCAQGSPEWKRARAGKITGSNFHLVRQRVGALTEQQARYVEAVRGGMTPQAAATLAGYKAKPKASGIERALEGLPVGDFTDPAKNYAFRVAIERISGVPLDEGHETWAMERGHELEPVARREHEIVCGVIVETCGFIQSEDGVFGCSLDGLIDHDGGAEYKCFVAPERVRAVVLDGDWSDVIDQAQGGLWLSGRHWIDTCLYCPALAPVGRALTVKRIYRDDDYIFELERDLLAFKTLVDQYEAMLRTEPVLATPTPEWTPAPLACIAAPAPALAPALVPPAKPTQALAVARALPADIFN